MAVYGSVRVKATLCLTSGGKRALCRLNRLFMMKIFVWFISISICVEKTIVVDSGVIT